MVFLAGCVAKSPLTVAIEQGNVAVVKTLVDQGANLRELADCGSGMSTIRTTPLECAVWFDRTEIIHLLIDKGADPSEQDYYGGSTPLSTAAAYGINRSAKVLLERGANPNAGKPLSNAAYHGNIELMKLLVAKGADIDTAIEELKTRYDSWLPERNKKIDSAIRLLDKLKPKPVVAIQAPAPSAASPQNITKEDIATIVQEAVEKAGRKEARPGVAVSSEIDRPQWTPAERIMGDKDLAIVIGIEGYQSLPKSDYSYDDAMLVKDYLKALGFKERNTEFLTDERATKSSIEKTVEVWLRNKTQRDSRIVIYYSGHGSPDPVTGEAYIVPYDGDPNYLSVTGYPLKRLYEKVGALPVKETVIVLDACFSGAGGRSVLAKGTRPLVISTMEAPRYGNMVVLTATQGAQISTSSPEKGHGIFTYYFLKALQEGKKSIADIYEYMKPRVEDDAKTLNVQQSPSVSPDVKTLRGRFILRN
jgi:hypothetical protein